MYDACHRGDSSDSDSDFEENDWLLERETNISDLCALVERGVHSLSQHHAIF
jgi:hypothetical protein